MNDEFVNALKTAVIDDNYFCRLATTTPAGPEPS